MNTHFENDYNYNYNDRDYEDLESDNDSEKCVLLNEDEEKGAKIGRKMEAKKNVFNVREYEQKVRKDLGMETMGLGGIDEALGNIGKKVEKVTKNLWNNQENELEMKGSKCFETKSKKTIGRKKYGDLRIESNDTGIETAKAEKKLGRTPKPKTNDSYKEYNPYDIAAFLELIEENPVLWDKSQDNCYRREVHLKVFDEIEGQCAKFMPRGNSAKKLWHELEIDYKKHVLKVLKAKSGSGSDDVKSDFLFAQNMAFLDGASQKRAVKNTYIIGTEKTILESGIVDIDKDESGAEFNKLSIETPKRKRKMSMEETPKRTSKQSRNGYLMGKIEESTVRIEKLIGGVLDSPSIDESSCKSSRICKIFEDHTKDWPEVEKYLAEAKILTTIRSLRMSDNYPSSSNSNNTPFNPMLSSLSDYSNSSNLHVPSNTVLSSLSDYSNSSNLHVPSNTVLSSLSTPYQPSSQQDYDFDPYYGVL